MIRAAVRWLLLRFASWLQRLQPQSQHKMPFHAVIQQDGDWFIGWIEELPGANTQAQSLDELRANLRDAALLIIESNRDDSRRAASGNDVRRETLTVAV
ncbi:MAG TPA: type II toxin-antitoxin system HicB family antitoxin [Kouleothrix sp.]|uniref:type II toxin-antitoxin system HicB family antitoxin n=1 Tax=Kouleothrix sp. TaxID=2779161 RepID=UPI002C206452|nr:type II toxin-antitoxin system HicB family antitoxin [Kouleothrix sp.]